MMNTIVDIHADDYAFSVNTSKDILDCIKAGKIDSFSVLSNMSCFDECMEMLYKEIPTLTKMPLMSVHLNIIEGYSLTKSSLLSRNGINTSSWADILFASIGGLKKDLKFQLKREIKAQIDKAEKAIAKCIEIAKDNNIPCEQKGLRIDSHIHFHPIPLVFDSLIEVIEEEKYNIEYIRNPKEPLSPFLRNIKLSFKISNLCKNIILNIFSFKIDKYIVANKLPKMYLWGLAMSGEMDIYRIKKLYPEMLEIAEKNNRKLEILFHPGYSPMEEYSEEIKIEFMKSSNNSENRKIEKEAILKINEVIGD